MTENAKRVLLVDDEEKLLQSIALRMKVLGFAPFTAASGMAAIDIATKNKIDMAIVDLQMPDMNGLVTITKLKEIHPGLKTVLLTGHGSDKVKQATESLNALYFEKDEMGAFWEFIKKLNDDGNVVVIRPTAESPRTSDDGVHRPAPFPANEIEIHPRRDRFETVDQVARPSTGPNPPGGMGRLRIVGETTAMQELRKNIERAASLDCRVTLRGEPGTGKELAARAIHAGSMRRAHRFLAINCANFSSEQLAGQLLGYKSGNLSEAIRTRDGIFSSGRVGTLLFDQVEEMPLNMQDQLQSILDMADGQPSGSLKETGLDIRILVATDTDLAKRVESGLFRKGIYDRLKLFELSIPPLRERRDDIHPLLRYFFDKFRQEMEKPVEAISLDVVRRLVDYDFPGNVRELKHIVERAVILAEGKTIERKHLPLRFLENPNKAPSTKPGEFSTLAELEKRYIVEVLEANHGNKSRTAQVLGISRAALWRKLKQLKAEGPDHG
ncbi:acetoacetate metabolism regulatory protein AtoC [Desulfosarcina alkanivorans]|uniref:Acetoacetate metabolism regulatory protein AtoC n=1 Tax=Desulfosarcina alkanivorans TaxID=571177 RepID=A0A5K7Z5H6_9BACT|nr:sigma-54 dependent transcriptional regulator [Desulfosarcina alkanivorans]BBO71847.1 acetoacetate metabolism regulatory protein AtoC [Desulfosarcina alkanivorans]